MKLSNNSIRVLLLLIFLTGGSQGAKCRIHPDQATTPSGSGCPSHRPADNSPCSGPYRQCEYGRHECCGEIFPDVNMICSGSSWTTQYVDSLCIIHGDDYPCYSTTSTPSTPSTTSTPSTNSTPSTTSTTSTTLFPYSAVCEKSLCFSTDGCSLAKNTLLTTLPQLNKQFRVSLEFQANEKPVSRANVFFFTYGGPTTVPALMFESTGQLQPWFDIYGQGNYGSRTNKSYSLHQWHSVEFSQTMKDGKYMYKVVVDGEVVNGPVENEQPQIFSNIEVYASNPWADSLNGSIRNLLINIDSSSVCGDASTTRSTTNSTTTMTTSTNLTNIVVTGGNNGAGNRLTGSETISTDGVCSQGIPPLPVALESFNSVFVDGNLMACGGWDNFNTQDACYFLKDHNSEWIGGPSMKIPRRHYSLTKVGEEVFAVGGVGENHVRLDSMEKYTGGQWTLLSQKLSDGYRIQHCTVYLKSLHSLVVIGGNPVPNKVQSFNISSGEWTDLAPLPGGINLLYSRCIVFDETIYVTGGSADSNYQKKVYKYSGSTWEASGELEEARQRHSIGILDEKVVVVGGQGENGALTSAEIMDHNGNWNKATWNISDARYAMAMSEAPAKKFPSPCL